MTTGSRPSKNWPAVVWVSLLALAGGGVVLASIINLTQQDFRLSGTQMGGVDQVRFRSSTNCRICHGDFDPVSAPYDAWAGSLMAQAGRDPLFMAQMTNANQDVANVGTFCMRCHVPMSYVSGHALPPDGSALDARDLDGVTCHLCHSMVDPIYQPGVSPPEDLPILTALGVTPQYYANAQFVLDPRGTRRGPLADAQPPHEFIYSPFHRTANMCGTCHEVGNVAVSRRPDGTYLYNAVDQATPSENPAHQFPLERTFSEWRLSAFANGGVDMHGRFNGEGPTVVSTCQDCHMPKVSGPVCAGGEPRTRVARHEFAGGAAQVLDLIAEFTREDPSVDQDAIAEGRRRSVSMLQRAASLEVSGGDGRLNVRVVNETGHKLPTGHIEGRRVWINVMFLDAADNIVLEHGAYDAGTAELDEHSTVVYEMLVGLSPEAAVITGLPAGVTGRMSLANTIEKDNRIPPRGFRNAEFEAAGAPVVGAAYADGQYWDDRPFLIPRRAVRAVVRLLYQNTPRHYIESLRNGNVTDNRGEVLYNLWEATGKGKPCLLYTSDAADE